MLLELYIDPKGEEEMRTKTRCWYCVIFASVFIIIMASLSEIVSAASDIDIVHEDYDALPVNHVKIEDLAFTEGDFSSDNTAISNIDFTDANMELDDFVDGHGVAYHGKVNWGQANTSAASDAVMSKTEIPGTFSMRFANKAILSDGEKADVLFTFSDWEVWLGAKPETVSSSDNIYIIAVKANLDGSPMFATGAPRKDLGRDGAVLSTIKQRIKVDVRIVEHGSDKVIDDKYDNMLMGFVDLDVYDNSIAYGKAEAERYKGAFAEGIELISGYSSPFLVADEDSMKTVIEEAGENIKIRGSASDEDTLSSGFICPVKPQGYSYYWYGSRSSGNALNSLVFMGTCLAKLQQVSVGASAGPGGSIEKEGSTDYVLNGTTTYKYKPNDGFYVSSLTVDGDEAEFDRDGGEYRFEKLTETNDEGDDHTIDVRFEAYPEIEIEKTVSNETPEEGDEVEYTIEIRQTNDDAVLRNAVMTDALPEGIELIEDTLECSEDGSVDFDNGVITYTQNELAGDAAISFRAVVTKPSGSIKNTASLTGDMADAAEDDAVITVGGEAEDEGQPEEVKRTEPEDDDNADKTYHGGSKKDNNEEPSVDDTADDSDSYSNYGIEKYDSDEAEIPKTGDAGGAAAAGFVGIIMVSMVVVWRLAAFIRR